MLAPIGGWSGSCSTTCGSCAVRRRSCFGWPSRDRDPDDTVPRRAVPGGGEKTLRELVREANANQREFQARVRTVLRGSYSNLLPADAAAAARALQFSCDNTAYRPIMDVLFDTAREVHYAVLRQPAGSDRVRHRAVLTNDRGAGAAGSGAVRRQRRCRDQRCAAAVRDRPRWDLDGCTPLRRVGSPVIECPNTSVSARIC